MAQSLRSSRRKLLVGLGLGGVGFAASSWTSPLLALGTASPLASLLPRVTGTIRQSGLQDWSSAIGGSFLVQGEAGPAAVILVAVKALDASSSRPANLRAQGFTLIFEGAADRVPAGNRTYVFQQSNGNQVQLFVGSKVAAGAKARLIAVLN
jgi:hypothetical protein